MAGRSVGGSFPEWLPVWWSAPVCSVCWLLTFVQWMCALIYKYGHIYTETRGLCRLFPVTFHLILLFCFLRQQLTSSH